MEHISSVVGNIKLTDGLYFKSKQHYFFVVNTFLPLKLANKSTGYSHILFFFMIRQQNIDIMLTKDFSFFLYK